MLVDWNATFTDVGVLRDRVRERGVSYVSMLARAGSRALKASNQAGLRRLTDGLFDDADVAYVRFTDVAGDTRFERIDEGFARRFQSERGLEFDAYYAQQIRRDLDGLLHDPGALQQRMATSRFRDVAERWNDLLTALGNRWSAPPSHAPSVLVLYQQAVRTDAHTRDDGITWALGVVEEEGESQPTGAVLVAFDMTRTNDAIRTKYLKGIGMVVFFVGLILVQNRASRRDKLRLLDVATRDASARAAIRDALPKPQHSHGLKAGAALEHTASHVDGVLVEVTTDANGTWILLVDPDGEGVDAASVALHVRSVFRARRGGDAPDLLAEVRAMGDASQEMPLRRPVGLAVVHVSLEGVVDAVMGPIGGLRRVGKGEAAALDREPMEDVSPYVAGPLRREQCVLGDGEGLLAVCGGLGTADPDAEAAVVAGFVVTSKESLVDSLGSVLVWARAHTKGRLSRDIGVAGVERV